ncbi:MAG: ArnT family glycosyltransferase [Candidatus Sumerlaeaceae bacterium]
MVPKKGDLRTRDNRHAAAAIVLLAVALVLVSSSGPPALSFLIQRIEQIAIAAWVPVAILTVAGIAGLTLVPREAARWLTGVECLIFGALAVLSGLSILTILAGIFGHPSREGMLVMLAAIGGWGIWRWKRRGGVGGGQIPWAGEPWSRSASLLFALFLLALVPVVTSAFAPPLLYDVTEYHLGAFCDYFRFDKLHFYPMHHNFYARFPFPVEALYYLGLVLEHPQDFAPKLLNLVSVGGLLALSWQWLRRWGVRRVFRFLAVLVILCHPVLLEVSLDAYIDAPVALLVLTALYGLELAITADLLRTQASAGLSLLPLIAWIAGTACVSKYTAAQFYGIPVALIYALPLWKMRRAFSGRQIVTTLICFFLSIVVWLGKNVYFYGNPLEPFFTWLFSRNDPAAVAREKFYIESHYPQPPWTLGYWATLLPRFDAVGWLIAAPLVGLPLVRRRPDVGRLLGVCVGSYLLWNGIRYSQDRFLLPTIILVIILSVSVLNELPTALSRGVGAGTFLLVAMCGIIPHTIRVAGGGEFGYLGDFVAMPASDNAPYRTAFYEKNLGALGKALTSMDRAGIRGQSVLLIYEARPYLFRHMPAVYNTVFDESELLRLAGGARSADEVTSALYAAGIRWVLVNMEELRRFIDQYARPDQLRQRGIRQPMREFSRIKDPEDLYPPFYRSPDWPSMREPVLAWLRGLRAKAVVIEGSEIAPVFIAPLEPPPIREKLIRAERR